MDLDLAVKPECVDECDGKHQEILVIDDDQVASGLLSRNLKRQGFRTRRAASGREGLTIARSRHPDLILLDLRLPDMDGFDLCEQLSDAYETCGIPIIVLTSMDRPDIVRRSRAVGCHFFMRKPYDPNALLILVEQAIRNTSWKNNLDAETDVS